MRLPRLIVNQPQKCVLQFVVAQCLRFAEEDRRLRRQLSATIDNALDGVQQVILVQKGLAVRGLARIQMTGKLPLIDALHLVRQRGRVAVIVVDTSDTKQHGGNIAAFRADERFGLYLRFRVGPGRPYRRVLGEEYARLARPVHEHGAGENKLRNFEALTQPSQQASRALNRDFVIFRARLADEIVIGGQMHNRGNARPVVLTQHVQAFFYAVIGSHIDRYVRATRRRRTRRLTVEAYDIVEAFAQAPH